MYIHTSRFLEEEESGGGGSLLWVMVGGGGRLLMSVLMSQNSELFIHECDRSNDTLC